MFCIDEQKQGDTIQRFFLRVILGLSQHKHLQKITFARVDCEDNEVGRIGRSRIR